MFIHFRWILIFTLQKDGAHLPHGFLSGAGSGAVTGPGGSEPLGGCQEDPGVAEASPGLLFGLELSVDGMLLDTKCHSRDLEFRNT